VQVAASVVVLVQAEQGPETATVAVPPLGCRRHTGQISSFDDHLVVLRQAFASRAAAAPSPRASRGEAIMPQEGRNGNQKHGLLERNTPVAGDGATPTGELLAEEAVARRDAGPGASAWKESEADASEQ
jgi:hypothetical protein